MCMEKFNDEKISSDKCTAFLTLPPLNYCVYKRIVNSVHFVKSTPLRVFITQERGNTMPDLSNLVPFHLGHVRNFYLLVLGQVKINLQFCIPYLIIIMNSHVV